LSVPPDSFKQVFETEGLEAVGMGVQLVESDLGDRRLGDEVPGDGDVPLTVLADQLTLLSAQLAAGEARFLELLGEFDRREGWAQWGLLSCAHWLSWRCGVDLGAARERVRVARRLPVLPAIRAALAAGEVSYAKVRAMTRAATPENEETLLVYARHGTASHVEQIVRGFRKVAPNPEADFSTPDPDSAAAAEPAPTSTTPTPDGEPDRASLRHHYDESGALVITARFPDAEHGMVVLQALRAAVAAESPEETQDLDDAPEPDTAEPNDTPAPNDTAEQAATATWDVSAETSTHPSRLTPMALDPDAPTRLADAMLLLAESFLARGAAVRPGSERWTVQVNVDIADLVPADAAAPVTGDNRPDRVHLADGQWVPRHVAQRLLCDATMVAVLTDRDADDPSRVPDLPGTESLNAESLNTESGNEDRGLPPRSSVTAMGKALRASMAAARVAASGGSGVLDVGRRTRAFSSALHRALVTRDQGCRFPGCTNRCGWTGTTSSPGCGAGSPPWTGCCCCVGTTTYWSTAAWKPAEASGSWCPPRGASCSSTAVGRSSNPPPPCLLPPPTTSRRPHPRACCSPRTPSPPGGPGSGATTPLPWRLSCPSPPQRQWFPEYLTVAT
jgi:hypothetical protein